MKHLGTTGNNRLRTVAEGPIIDFLMVGAWAFELRRGGRQAAAEVTRAALSRWVAAGLPFSMGADGQPRYDPVEVMNYMKWSNLRHGDTFWAERCLTTGRRIVLEQDEGRLSPGQFSALPVRDFTFVLTRSFNLESIAPGTSLRLRLPLPLEDQNLRNLKVGYSSDCGTPVTYLQFPGRLEARFGVPDTHRVGITFRADFRLGPDSSRSKASDHDDVPPLDSAEFELYTRSSEGFINVTPRIRSLSMELAGKGRSTSEIISSFWDYLMDHLFSGSIHYEEIDPVRPMDWLLDNGWYDCQLGAALLVSLCRAQKIPARIVNGYILYSLVPGNHFWAEIWTKESGWAPFDLLSWDLAGGGRERAWRNCFAGTLDYRMKTQCFPRSVVGPMSLRLPPQWNILLEAIPDGIRITMADSHTGTLVYCDEISVKRGPAGA